MNDVDKKKRPPIIDNGLTLSLNNIRYIKMGLPNGAIKLDKLSLKELSTRSENQFGN